MELNLTLSEIVTLEVLLENVIKENQSYGLDVSRYMAILEKVYLSSPTGNRMFDNLTK